MKTLTKLPVRALEYYINARRWKTHLNFFNVEVIFLNRLMEEHFLQLAGEDRIQKLTGLSSKLLKLMDEKHHINEIIDHQLKDLELLAEAPLNDRLEELAGKQAHLEYLMIDLIHEYREVKSALYAFLDKILDERKLLVN